MCGIIGYAGKQQAAPHIVSGLQKLEYRGYDSAGMAVLNNGAISCKKRAGKLIALEQALHKESPMPGCIGIGHTRWATHGAPTACNAHPHFSADGKFAVVHNGIIENYLELRQELEAEGIHFVSETDTEVVPQLLQKYYNGNLTETVRLVVSKLRGAYALGILSVYDAMHLYAVRKGAPLIVGLGEDANFIASDIPAILSETRKIYLLDEGEFVVLSATRVTITDAHNRPVHKKIFEADWDANAAKKDGYAHYMRKEIMEQPRAAGDTVLPRLRGNAVQPDLLALPEDYCNGLNKIYMVACGSAYHAGLVGKYVIEHLARIPVEVDLASEFRYRNPIIGKGDLVIFLSQSGETLDTLEALREAKKKEARTLSIVNVKGSSIARESDHVLYTHAGPEIAVATTKAYTAQMQLLFLLGLHLAQIRGEISLKQQEDYVAELRTLPGKISEILQDVSPLEELAKTYKDVQSMFFIGRGIDYAVALEGALKLKEISYMHAEAYAAGELKHGTISLIEAGTPVVALATQENLLEKTLSNIKEVKSRGAKVIALVMEGQTRVEKEADAVIYIPKTLEVFSGALSVIPLQILAYFVSYHKGLDVDKPRNLAKSVTVE